MWKVFGVLNDGVVYVEDLHEFGDVFYDNFAITFKLGVFGSGSEDFFGTGAWYVEWGGFGNGCEFFGFWKVWIVEFDLFVVCGNFAIDGGCIIDFFDYKIFD